MGESELPDFSPLDISSSMLLPFFEMLENLYPTRTAFKQFPGFDPETTSNAYPIPASGDKAYV
jgi:hypothetical protein